jgi:hypothetical protein
VVPVSDDDVDLESVKEEFQDQTDHGTQLDETSRDDHVDEMIEVLDEIESEGDNMIGVRHTSVATLVSFIVDDDDRADEIGADLEEELGQSPRDDYAKSHVAAYAALVGIQQVAPELLEDLSEARAQRERRL